MSYEPTVWAAGDVITAAKMNKIEQGIENSGGSLMVNVIEESADSTYRLDKTTGEIVSAINSGMVVWLSEETTDEETGITAQDKSLLTEVTVSTSDSGSTYTFITSYNTSFEATSLEDYPIDLGSNSNQPINVS